MVRAKDSDPRKPAACRLCKHFYITYDPRFPYGCRAMGFKSLRMPGVTVQEASGMQCESFSPKENR
ncbi:MAG: hypothetical protein DRH20_15700 [Deltaproteobacteria bacterium]|nr:MAG: hypothetical protein DRH20_15700 [Deltaproteobacteria bacterium]